MDRELGLAGVGAGQVLRGAGVHARVFGLGVEDDEGIFWVVVHKREVAALGEQYVVLQQTSRLLMLVFDSTTFTKSSISYLIPQNVRVWFPFDHDSQPGRLPDVHVHILHDGFKLRRHCNRRID